MNNLKATLIGLALATLALNGFAAAPGAGAPGHDGVLDVHSDDLDQYWVAGNKEFRLRTSPDASCESIIQQYVIDSNGEVRNYEVVAVRPDHRQAERRLTRIGQEMVEASDFRAAETNTERVAVRVRTPLVISTSSDCEPPEFEQLAQRLSER